MVYLKESVVLKAKMKARIIAATNQNLEHMIVEKSLEKIFIIG